MFCITWNSSCTAKRNQLFTFLITIVHHRGKSKKKKKKKARKETHLTCNSNSSCNDSRLLHHHLDREKKKRQRPTHPGAYYDSMRCENHFEYVTSFRFFWREEFPFIKNQSGGSVGEGGEGFHGILAHLLSPTLSIVL